MSYTIAYEGYQPLLESDDENVVKNALQKIFELLVSGSSMLRSKKEPFTRAIERHISSPSQKVRKWAYHCACYYQDDCVLLAIKKQLAIEQNAENIMWALTALSVHYDDVRELRRCVGKRHDEFIETISRNYLTDALVLFGEVVKINPNTILSTNNSADLAALTKIYAYKDLVQDKYPDVELSVIQELETHDDPYVREYAYWAHVLGSSKVLLSNISLELEDKDVGVRKWQVALQIQKGDEDFIVSALKPVSLCPQKVPVDIKVGIILGLSRILYSIKYVSAINKWFEKEPEEAVLVLLIDYIIANCYENHDDGTYFDVIKDSLNNKILTEYIVNKINSNPKYKLSVIPIGESYNLDFIKLEETNVQSFNFNGSGNTIAIANDNSTATASSYQASGVDELTKLLQEIKHQANTLPEQDKKTVEEGLSFIETEGKSDKPRKTLIKAVLDGLKAIKGTVQFASAVTALTKFFEL